MSEEIKKVISDITSVSHSLHDLRSIIRVCEHDVQDLLKAAQEVTDTEEVQRFNPDAKRFVVGMQKRLNANSNKGGWEDCTKEYLYHRLVQEVGELGEALLCENPSQGEVYRESSDVGNFSMMIDSLFGSGRS